MSFERRWQEFGSARVPDPPWKDVWALVSKSLASGKDLREVEDVLYRWRYTGWILMLSDDPDTCLACGGQIVDRYGPQTSCGNACRQLRARCRAKGELTPWGERVQEAMTVRAEILKTLHQAHALFLRQRMLRAARVIVPPDWTVFRQAPVLPPRCGGCSSGRAPSTGCEHTGRGPCLFSGIGREADDGVEVGS